MLLVGCGLTVAGKTRCRWLSGSGTVVRVSGAGASMSAIVDEEGAMEGGAAGAGVEEIWVGIPVEYLWSWDSAEWNPIPGMVSTGFSSEEVCSLVWRRSSFRALSVFFEPLTCRLVWSGFASLLRWAERLFRLP